MTTPQLDSASATVEALARALELHDYRRGSFGETAAHAARVTQMGLLLAEAVDFLIVFPEVVRCARDGR